MAEPIANPVSKAVPQPTLKIGLTWVWAWRNLWRNPRRTWLTAGGIAFASLLVTMSMALQQGSYVAMISSATDFYLGQAQINHIDYPDESRLEQTVPSATALQRDIEGLGGVRVAPRVQAFALASLGERSFGAVVVGVVFDREIEVVSFFERVTQGRLPMAQEEVLIGEVMARNLGARLGDELVLLGTAKEGGIGAVALTISGFYDSGRLELDRSLVFTHLSAVQNGFGLADEVHQLVIRFDSEQVRLQRVAKITGLLSASAVYRPWQELLPEVVQSIELDRVSAVLFYGMILLLVTFSVVNTFIMIVFERTKEFGVLLALGTRPGIVIRHVQAEAMMMWLVGTVIGLLLSNALVGWAAVSGIPLGDIEELAQQYYMPSRLYPVITWSSLALAPLVLLVGTQLAALLATVRIHKLNPVTALRSE